MIFLILKNIIALPKITDYKQEITPFIKASQKLAYILCLYHKGFLFYFQKKI